MLPEGVERAVKKTPRKTYVNYYWNPGRGTKREGERLPLPDPQKDLVAFSRELARLQKETLTA